MMNLEYVTHSTALDVQTAAKHVNEVGMPKSSHFMMVFAEIFLYLAKLGDLSAASQRVEVLLNPTFCLDIFERIINNLKD